MAGDASLFCAGVLGGEKKKKKDWLRRRREASVLAGGWRCAEGGGSRGLWCSFAIEEPCRP